MSMSTPPNWGKDSLSEFIDNARNNTMATFVRCPNEYNTLKDIHDIFRYAIDNLISTPEWFADFFLLKSHAAYLGGVRFSISGQCSETYVVLRSCIESALYGLYMSRNNDGFKTWLNRHDSKESLKRVKNEFKMVNLFATLKATDFQIHDAAKALYDRAIDFGGHPNERALTSLLNKTNVNGGVKFELNYLSGDTPAFRFAVKTTAQCGLCSLLIFKNVYKERFSILGIDGKLDKLKIRVDSLKLMPDENRS
jgi:hypothetical protein